MVIFGYLIHPLGDGANLALFVQVFHLTVVDNIVDSELYLLLFFLIIGEDKGLYELRTQLIVNNFGPTNLNPLLMRLV
jgi:hypothetical protein